GRRPFVDKEVFHVRRQEPVWPGDDGDSEAAASPEGRGLSLAELQARIEVTFGERDRARGVDGTFRWWVEEVGEVAKALRRRDPAELEHELGDALAWLVSVANAVGVRLDRAVARFAAGCPRCHHSPCTCPPA
ncbi:MAG TPA: MazG nucleotide pyrophosphohydrolase domain-containing protein, partial [Actinomycetes bacterium]|nr:MazG nucleotide pyrophosphohydrolase domain-containing protein [Actinomycetes bacterium]